MTETQRPKKIAILGGGIAGLATALELTEPVPNEGRYEVTVFLPGWRLGGKGASGRDKDNHYRNTEHGLHVWFGFYENAFNVLRRCYELIDRPDGAPLQKWEDAMKSSENIVIWDDASGSWSGHDFKVPRNDGTEPGDGKTAFNFWGVIQVVIDGIKGRIRPAVDQRIRLSKDEADVESRVTLPAFAKDAASDVDREFGTVFSKKENLDPVELLELAHHLSSFKGPRKTAAVAPLRHHATDRIIARLLGAFRNWMWRFVVSKNLDDKELVLLFTIVDITATATNGMVKDDLRKNGFNSINDLTFDEWLKKHGAKKISIEGSFLRVWYDLCFGYDDGNPNTPNIAAGALLRTMIRLSLAFKGGMIYEMQAGMGDVVFAPLYEVLKKRGVKFRFFTPAVQINVAPDGDGHIVDSIEVVEQVKLKGDDYRPLVEVKALDCWPLEPHWDQIEDGTAVRKRLKKLGANLEFDVDPLDGEREVLKRGTDFDHAVIAFPVTLFEEIAKSLCEAVPSVKKMVQDSRGIMTVAFQLWLNKSLKDGLGWSHGAKVESGAYVEPCATFIDASQLISREDWPPDLNLQTISYFTGVMPDKYKNRKGAYGGAKDIALDLLTNHMGPFFPKAVQGRGSETLDWNNLVDASDRVGKARFDAQYWRGNWDKTERYLTSPASLISSRLWPWETGCSNLTFAGDWTRSNIDMGCIEAAVISGMQASRNISGHPKEVFGENDDWFWK